MKSYPSMNLGAALVVVALTALPAWSASVVTIEKADGGKYHVNCAGKLFTTLHTEGLPKPILYPIIGPNGVRMTRDYPMKEGTPDEAKDHPHHQSLWFTHGNVNGVDFWAISKNSGKIVTTRVTETREAGEKAWITMEHNWVDAKGATVCTDVQKVTFHNFKAKGGLECAAIDYDITIKASEGDVVFGDTKEGSMGIRTHPALEIKRGATAVNSEGESGKGIWGKRAKWVDYSAKVDDQVVGVAILDNPSNPRHPTWWHAREYGLVAANPFGIADFEKKPKGTGDFKIAKGQSATFRYRFLFHGGDAKAADIAGEFEKYAAEK